MEWLDQILEKQEAGLAKNSHLCCYSPNFNFLFDMLHHAHAEEEVLESDGRG